MKLRGAMGKGISLGIGVIVITVLTLVGCGGGGGSSANNVPSNTTLTAAQIASLTAAQIANYSDAQIATLGVDIKYLSDSALQALTPGTNASHPAGQIESITAAQIAALSPAQVRMIGAAGVGGSITTSQIQWLNSAAWAALVSDRAQVAAITPAEIATMWDSEIVALGVNINALNNAALNALTASTLAANAHHDVGQIESITVTQIAALSPAQVRMIGAAGPGGSITTSQIQWLNSGAWAALVSDRAQVAAITPAEIATIWDSEIVALGANINALSNAALNALTATTLAANAHHDVGQIESITVTQIASLSPAQVRMLGAAGVGGSVTTSQIKGLNAGAWAVLASDPLQVAAITPAEVATLTGAEITALGTNINLLTNSALGAMTLFDCSGFCASQIASISTAQIAVLNPAQLGIIANIVTPFSDTTTIAWLNIGAFSSLSAAQLGVLTPSNLTRVTAAQLASLSTTAITGLTPAATASLTVAQKASLSAAQHTACGC